MSSRRRPPGWLVALALTAYPSWWKERYGDQVAATCDDLLAEGRRPVRLASGLLVSALDARVLGTGLPPVSSLYRSRAKVALVSATLPMLAMVPLVIWIAVSTGFREVVQHEKGYLVHSANGVSHRVLSQPVLSVGGRLAADCANALFLLIVPLSVLILMVAWREVGSGFWGRGFAWLAFWASPAFFAVAAMGLAVWHGTIKTLVTGGYSAPGGHGRPAEHVIFYAPGGHPLLAEVLGVATWAALGLVLVATAVIMVTVARIDLPAPTVEIGVSLGRLLSAVSILAALAVIGWAVGLALQPSPDTHISYAVTRAALAPWSIVLAMVLTVVAALVVTGFAQARRSWHTAIWLTAT